MIITIKRVVKIFIPIRKHRTIGKKYRNLKARFYNKDLTKFAEIFNCDKWGRHSYTIHYQDHFYKLRRKKLRILEIGIGGYKSPNSGGASLRMWKAFFINSKIFGIDLFLKKGIEEQRIKTFQGSQDNKKFLMNVIKKVGQPDIIIDDGSHINSHIVNSFKILFPFLKDGGIYVIEDIQTSYWPEFGGSTKNMESGRSAVNFFKSLIHGLNHSEFLNEKYNATYYDKNIVSLHFYHNLIFIYKGPNTERSNIVVNNRWPY